MSNQFITTIAINLGMLLLVSWGLGLIIFIRLTNDNNALANDLDKARKQLKKAKQPTDLRPTPDPEYPLEPVVINDEEESSYLLHTIDSLNNDLTEKNHKLQALSQLYEKQQALLADSKGEKIPVEFTDNQKSAQKLIQQLQDDINNSQHTISELENKLREGRDKDSRIAILEETDRQLRNRIQQLKNNQGHTTGLTEDLEKTNNKNRHLREDNEKLKRIIKELTSASEEHLKTICKITEELNKASKLERYQKDVIQDLEKHLTAEKSSSNDATRVRELEEQIQNINATLERTIIEKEFAESYLLEMDKALEGAKEIEQALERAHKEIETLEMHFPRFESEEKVKQPKAQTAVDKPLPRLDVSEDKSPKLYNIIEDNRLFGILHEFWMTLDTPPIQLVAESNINRPKGLNFWVKTDIHQNEFFVAIGTTKALCELLAKAMFSHPDKTTKDADQHDALGKIGNIIAGNLANELNPDHAVGITEHIGHDIDHHFKNVAIATEVLLTANNHPIYIALLKPTISTGQGENKELDAS